MNWSDFRIGCAVAEPQAATLWVGQNQADFSGIFSDQHFISEVRQKAFVEANEEGTEAAAVMRIPMPESGIEMNPPPPFEMIVDRPFLFAIVDTRSEMILFMGLIDSL